MIGENVRIELQSTNLTSGAPLRLWSPNTRQRLLAPKDRLVIFDLLVCGQATGQSGVGRCVIFTSEHGTSYTEALGDNMAIVELGAAANTFANIMIRFGLDGQPGARGVMPRAITLGSGRISITGRGGIVQD